MLKFLKKNYIYLLIFIPLNLVIAGVFFKLEKLPFGGFLIFLITAILSIVVIKQSIRIKKLKLETRELTSSRDSSLEYIDALWKSQKKIIQNEKLTSLNSLVAGVAHELNTPLGIALTSISFLEELLKGCENKELIDEATPMLNLAVSNIKRSITLVENFKEISGTGNEDDISPVELTELIDFACCRIASEKTDKLQCNIVYDFPKNLWVNLSHMTITVILRNIIENAYDFAFDNTNKPEIVISTIASEGDLILKIKDNGKGIPKNSLTRIFDPFYTTKRSNNHYGLGLAISYNLISRHYNGDISCDSQEGVGTVFTITVPEVIYQKNLKPKLADRVL